jgi:hypothetical protein
VTLILSDCESTGQGRIDGIETRFEVPGDPNGDFDIVATRVQFRYSHFREGEPVFIATIIHTCERDDE